MSLLNNFIRYSKLSFLVLLSFCVSLSSLAAEFTGRLSMHWNDKHHCTKHAQMFVDEVFEKSNGRLKIEVFHSGQLFGIREIMGGITSGAVDLGGVVGVVGFPKINKNFNVATIPGLFDSFEQQREFFQKSDKGQEIWGDLLNKTNNPGIVATKKFLQPFFFTLLTNSEISLKVAIPVEIIIGFFLLAT